MKSLSSHVFGRGVMISRAASVSLIGLSFRAGAGYDTRPAATVELVQRQLRPAALRVGTQGAAPHKSA